MAFRALDEGEIGETRFNGWPPTLDCVLKVPLPAWTAAKPRSLRQNLVLPRPPEVLKPRAKLKRTHTHTQRKKTHRHTHGINTNVRMGSSFGSAAGELRITGVSLGVSFGTGEGQLPGVKRSVSGRWGGGGGGRDFAR